MIDDKEIDDYDDVMLIIFNFSPHFTNYQEYGHYSTAQELQRCRDNTPDCPVCYDNHVKPVTLDCQHIFCEVCISEWLDKEKTCPVCRSEVRSTSPILSSMREASAASYPLLV